MSMTSDMKTMLTTLHNVQLGLMQAREQELQEISRRLGMALAALSEVTQRLETGTATAAWEAATGSPGAALRPRMTPNDHMLALIEQGSFNNFDGEATAEVLRANRHLWSGVLFVRNRPGITLRDLPLGLYNADTVVLLTNRSLVDTLFGAVHPGLQADATEIVTIDGMKDPEESNGLLSSLLYPHWAERPNEQLGAFLGSYKTLDDRALIALWWD